jgi:hypothetical protein
MKKIKYKDISVKVDRFNIDKNWWCVETRNTIKTLVVNPYIYEKIKEGILK